MKACFLLPALFAVSAIAAAAAEIKATVQSTVDKYATIVTDAELLPRPGDKVEIYFKIPGGDDEVSVAKGHVYEIADESIQVEIVTATGTVAKGQFARITSANPLKKAMVAAPPPPTPGVSSPPASPLTPPPPPPATPPPGSDLAGRGPRMLTFDLFPPGAELPANALEFAGGRVVASDGKPMIDPPGPEMVLPAGRTRVLLIHGERQTSLTVAFEPPLKRFSLTRIGVINGASIPTWQIESLDTNGNRLESVGENHGLYLQTRTVTLARGAIARVRLTTDNRNGNSVWATYNALPIAEIEMER